MGRGPVSCQFREERRDPPIPVPREESGVTVGLQDGLNVYLRLVVE